MQPELRESHSLFPSLALLAGASHASADQHSLSLFNRAAGASVLQAITAPAAPDPLPQMPAAVASVPVSGFSAGKAAGLLQLLPASDLPVPAQFEAVSEPAMAAFTPVADSAAMLTKPDWFLADAQATTPLNFQEFTEAAPASGDAVANPVALAGDNFLTDLLEALKQAAEEARAEFAEGADGSRQEQIGEQLREAAREVAQEVRGFFQDNVRGQVREASEELLQTTELGMSLLDAAEPLTQFDYYGASADVINTSIDAIASPLGGVRLPSVGPLLANPQEEITNYLQF